VAQMPIISAICSQTADPEGPLGPRNEGGAV